jgi:hypothetical protein
VSETTPQTSSETAMGTAPVRPPAGPTWMPRHAGREAAAGLVWLPRLIDKGRRVLDGQAAGRDLLHPYLFGVNDPMDGQLLRFLGLGNEDVLEVLRREPDDAAAAAELVRRSGRSPQECAAWSARTLRRVRPFLAMTDADEGRRPPGLGTTFLRLVYNGLVMPPTYPLYRRAEQRRLAGGAPPAAGGQARAVAMVTAGALAVGVAWWLLARRGARSRT